MPQKAKSNEGNRPVRVATKACESSKPRASRGRHVSLTISYIHNQLGFNQGLPQNSLYSVFQKT